MVQSLEKVLNSLESAERTAKKRGYVELRSFVTSTKKEELPDLFDKISKPLCNGFYDPLEKCREQAVSTVSYFLENLDPKSAIIPVIIPTIYQRLVVKKLLEPSEEVRLLLFKLLTFCIENCGELLVPYVKDVVEILASGVNDRAPELKKQGCCCVLGLAQTTPKAMYGLSDRLIRPLVDCLSHQQWRVRTGAVRALGALLLVGDTKDIQQVTGPLAQRLFDDSFQVRMELVKISGSWLVSLHDRYSFFPFLLPLILTSLKDPIEAVRSEANRLWSLAGLQYLNENEKDFKDRLDFLSATLDHYPPEVERPNLGCRGLVEREGYKLVLTICRELSDWLLPVRIKAAQLLGQIVLHMEGHITQQFSKIFPPVAKSLQEREPSLTPCLREASCYLGYFVPPESYCSLVVEDLREPTPGELELLACLVSSSQRTPLSPYLTKLTSLLPVHSFDEQEQAAGLHLAQSLLTVAEADVLEPAGDLLWRALVSTLGLSASHSTAQTAMDLLVQFEMLGGGDRRAVYNKYCHLLVSELVSTEVWSLHCPQQFIFSALAEHACEIVGPNAEQVIKILKTSMSPDSDPEVVLKIIMSTNKILTSENTAFLDRDCFQRFRERLVGEVLLEQLRWRAGLSAESIRTAATSCLLTCLAVTSSPTPTSPELLPDFLPTILSLLEDTAPLTRQLAARTLPLLAPLIASDSGNFSKVIEIVLKRLDDCEKSVRELSVIAMKSLYSEHEAALKKSDAGSDHLSLNFSLLEFVFSSLLVHLDDQDSHIQHLVLDCLKVISKFNCSLLKGKINISTFRDKKIAEELINFLNDPMSASQEVAILKLE